MQAKAGPQSNRLYERNVMRYFVFSYNLLWKRDAEFESGGGLNSLCSRFNRFRICYAELTLKYY
ncbi:hypothetical protein C4Q31_13210 [Leptospira borgpetersenii serovar Ceylonica]|nr:hypothetical protein C4Q31_13210 [Leptospira borgpetersenii serovar Ceylonica]